MSHLHKRRAGRYCDMILYGYALSSASYRVRIALALKGVAYESVIKNLRVGEHRLPSYLVINKQGFVPALKLTDGEILTQSISVLEYLEELHPEPPLLPKDALGKVRVRALSQAIASDIHPLNNLRVLRYLERQLGLDKPARDVWYRHWINTGFAPLEHTLASDPTRGRYCYGDSVTMADLCLVPQVFNARRFQIDLAPYPTIVAIDTACRALPAFRDSAPDGP